MLALSSHLASAYVTRDRRAASRENRDRVVFVARLRSQTLCRSTSSLIFETSKCRTFHFETYVRCCSGSPTLDNGLHIVWDDGRHWTKVPEDTSPRGVVSHLRMVYWVAVQTMVTPPRPGLYAAFFRVKQARRRQGLRFLAEWKADASENAGDRTPGFVEQGHMSQASVDRQECEAVASWRYEPRYRGTQDVEETPYGWFLLHVGNILVRHPRPDVIGSVSDTEGAESNIEETKHDVQISFGGNNPNGCNNFDVDFAALAPLRLSWDIERVVAIGHRKGHSDQAAVGEEVAQDVDRIFSPLSLVPPLVIALILEFSQPTVARPMSLEVSEHGEGSDGDGVGSDHNNEHWTVF